jgi:hypothetical protein
MRTLEKMDNSDRAACSSDQGWPHGAAAPSVFHQSELVKHLSQDFMRKVPLKLGIMSTVSSNEIVDLIGNILTGCPGIEVRAPRKNSGLREFVRAWVVATNSRVGTSA